jgi:hypothetical protein
MTTCPCCHQVKAQLYCSRCLREGCVSVLESPRTPTHDHIASRPTTRSPEPSPTNASTLRSVLSDFLRVTAASKYGDGSVPRSRRLSNESSNSSSCWPHGDRLSDLHGHPRQTTPNIVRFLSAQSHTVSYTRDRCLCVKPSAFLVCSMMAFGA